MSDDNLKVPSQVFRWFEKMKSNYEQSVQAVLKQFEQFTASQQARVDSTNNAHILSLKQLHQSQIEQYHQHFNQLHQDIDYYKKQISSQQKTIGQLNNRYDAVMSILLAEKRKDIDIKEVFTDNEFTPKRQHELITTARTKTLPKEQTTLDTRNCIEKEEHSDDTKQDILPENAENQIDIAVEASDKVNASTECEELFTLAMQYRNKGELESAFFLFEQAAKRGHTQAMGAMGRSYFLAEGTEENQTLGLSWLICAATNGLPQAKTRVEQYQLQQPELYQRALDLFETLF